MTDDRTTAAVALLVLADPVPVLPRIDAGGIDRVVRRAITAGGVPVLTPARTSRPDASRRGPLVIAVAGLAVTAVAVWVAVVGLVSDGRTDVSAGGRPPAAAEAPPTTAAPTVTPTGSPSVAPRVPRTVAPPAGVGDPVVLLHAAATVSAAATSAPPRPDQFLYVREDNGYQAWLSMDGTHDGLVLRPDDGDRIPLPGCRGTTTCTPDPAYKPDVPSDPAALRQYLVTEGGGSATNNVAKQVLAMLEFDYLTPATRGALYTVLSGYDGLSVVGVAAEPDAVGVTWSYGGGSVTLVFGRADHAYRGYLTDDGSGLDGVRTAVVDAVGRTA